ncbi:ribonuclease E inhibitor RraB [Burkholderia anthina]|uniref:ribonuclease E inhibitor RraB n=1 Tax=Burkholderia anthina TaxID=179879 RepID=UPI00158BA0BB|nr:ribonuclease E inhibitor RraB [Burkholderia anthina]
MTFCIMVQRHHLERELMTVIRSGSTQIEARTLVSTIANLMDTAIADVELLRTLDASGDDFGRPRDVEFLMRGPSAEKAAIVAGFINDYQYGRATVDQSGDEHRVLVVINMPIQQHNILSVSGFMACVSLLYGLHYDGWGCIALKRH